MSKLPRVSGRQCIRALEKIGFYRVRQRGSHIIMRRDSPYAKTVVPNDKELPPGTLRAIIRQTGLTVKEFIDLL